VRGGAGKSFSYLKLFRELTAQVAAVPRQACSAYSARSGAPEGTGSVISTDPVTPARLGARHWSSE